MRFNTLKRNFTKIKCKFFQRLRNRGYEKKFLSRLFSKVKFGCRNELLAISENIIDEFEIDSERSDTVLINDAERMFQNIFTEVRIPIENKPQNIRTFSVNSLSPFLPLPKVCCAFTIITLKKEKNYGKPKSLRFFCLFFYPFSGRGFC